MRGVVWNSFALRRQIRLNGRRSLSPAIMLPRPRLAFGQLLRGIASASLDVSDGLIADCGHIAEASNVRIEIDARRVPLSAALTQLSGEGLAAVVNAVTAGDDYEIGFTRFSHPTYCHRNGGRTVQHQNHRNWVCGGRRRSCAARCQRRGSPFAAQGLHALLGDHFLPCSR